MNLKLTSLLALLALAAPVQASTNTFLCFDLDKVVWIYQNEFRLHEKNDPLFYDHNDISLKYLLIDKYLDVHTDYRLILQNKNGSWGSQSMFLEGFNLKLPEGKWGKISMNDRIEIGLNQNPTPDTWQLRNFPKYDFPLKLTKFKFQPFVANESFWDVQHSFDFVKNRVYSGLDWQITDKILGASYYYWEAAKGNPWTHSDVFVMQINFLF